MGVHVKNIKLILDDLIQCHDMNEKLHFEIVIQASAQHVWEVMLAQDTYMQWTSVFSPGSRYDGSWDQGSKIRFVAPDGNGMASEIAQNIPYRFISVKHLGYVKDGVEDTTSEEAKKWNSAFENYTFSTQGEATKLEIDLEIPHSIDSKTYKEMFEGMWPKALIKLKELCE
jgi:uncharacterized protein YndB with AHSA1/START domain